MSNKSRRFPFAHALTQFLRVLLPVAGLMISDLAGAQEEGIIAEGSKIRISVPGAKKVTGVVKSRTADSTTIFVEGYGGTRRFLNSDIVELKISRGRTWTAGARKGAIWGGGLGAILAVGIFSDPEPDNYYTSDSKNELATSMLVGSLIWGVGIGALVKAEDWESLPVRPRFAVSPSSGGVGVSVAFSPSFLH